MIECLYCPYNQHRRREALIGFLVTARVLERARRSGMDANLRAWCERSMVASREYDKAHAHALPNHICIQMLREYQLRDRKPIADLATWGVQ